LSVLTSYIFVTFFFNDTATTAIYTLSLHDALPISAFDGETERAIDLGPYIIVVDRELRQRGRNIQQCERMRCGAQIVASGERHRDRKSTRLNSSHRTISYAVFCLKKKK